MKYRSCISLLFLFAVTVIQAHSIIPHHHHAESYLYGCTHPVAKNKDKPVEAPWHCHALNHVVYIERPVLSKNKPVLPFPPDPLPGNCQLAPEYTFLKAYIYILPIMAALQNPLIPIAPGRAPPAVTGV